MSAVWQQGLQMCAEGAQPQTAKQLQKQKHKVSTHNKGY